MIVVPRESLNPKVLPQSESKGGLTEKIFYFGQGRRVPRFDGRAPALTRTVPEVNYPTTGAKWKGLTRHNNFAAQWTGGLVVKTAGTYNFMIESDDGSNLYIDHKQVVNNDGLHAMRKRVKATPLLAGVHALRLDFFERGGHAGMKLKYKGPDSSFLWVVVPQMYLTNKVPKEAAPRQANAKMGLKEEVFYFSGREGRHLRRLPNLQGRNPNLERLVANINYAARGHPWDGLQKKDNFAVRWTGSLSIKTAGTYTFALTSDDGSKLYLDSSIVVSNDGLHPMRTRKGTKQMTTGPHLLRVEFFEKGGGAGCILKYQGADTQTKLLIIPREVLQPSREAAGGLKEEVFYFRQRSKLVNLEGLKPALVRTVPVVNYAKSGRAWPGLSRRDNFAVRWTGLVTIKKWGNYELSLTSDDGSKLRIDDQVAVNNDGLHAMREMVDTKFMSNGAHRLELTFFEKHGAAGCILKYAGPDTSNFMKVVPRQVLLPSVAKGSAYRQTDEGLTESVYYTQPKRRVPNFDKYMATMTRTVSSVDYPVTGREWPGLTQKDNFAVRWTGYLAIRSEGHYTFSLRSDDGSLLYVDAKKLVDNDGLHAMRTKTGSVHLGNILHSLKIEFFERGGGAGIIFKYKGSDTGGHMRVVPREALYKTASQEAELACRRFGLSLDVFPYKQLSQVPNLIGRQPSYSGVVAQVAYPKTNRGFDGVPGTAGTVFAARWTGFLMTHTSGEYTFYLNSDDGSKLYIDNTLVVNNDGRHSMRTRASKKTLAEGVHSLRVVFFEAGGAEGILLKFKGPDVGNTPIVIPKYFLRAPAGPK
jgi:hypothetical protein